MNARETEELAILLREMTADKVLRDLLKAIDGIYGPTQLLLGKEFWYAVANARRFVELADS